MAGWRVERTPRAASGPVPSSTHGGSPLMPPQSQGAERRPERRAGRTGSRWVLRALVIGGLAGAAWLLTGAAAQAAEPNGEPVTGSPFGIVLDDEVEAAGTESVVGELLKAAVQPLESDRHVVLSMSNRPDPVRSEPMETHDGTTLDTTPLGDALRTAIAPLRTSDGTADDVSQLAAEDEAAEGETAAPVARASAPAPVAAKKVSARHSTRARSARSGLAPARHARAHPRSHARRHAPAARPAAPEAIRENLPADEDPAPARTNLGAVSGIPATGGPGSNTENGSSAVLPAGIANGPVACHRCPVAPDVDARRHNAEAPTVSPD